MSEAEATQFACNVISQGRHIIMGTVRSDLAQRLTGLGFEVQQIDLSEFLRGGGSAKSLVLRISDLDLATI